MKDAEIIFYSKGKYSRVLRRNEHGTFMIETCDDHIVTGYWKWSQEDSMNEFKMSKSDDERSENGCQTFGDGWRILATDGPDKLAIRYVISAINYISGQIQSNETTKAESNETELNLVINTPEFHDHVKELTEASRSKWENNPDEAIPTPIPSRDIIRLDHE